MRESIPRVPEYSPPLKKNYQRKDRDQTKQWKEPTVKKTLLQNTSPITQTHQRDVPNTSKRRRSSPFTQTNQPSIYKSLNHQPFAQKAPPKRSTLPSTQTYKQNVKNIHYPTEVTEQILKKVCMRQPERKAPAPALTRSMQSYQKNDYNQLKQNASINRKKRKNARTHKTSQLPSSLFPPERSTRPCCTACALAQEQTNTNPQQTRGARTPTSLKKSPFSLHNASVLPLLSTLHAKCLAPPKHAIAVPRENQPVSTTLSRAPSSDEMWFLRVSKEYTRPQQEASLPINDPTVNNKCSKHTTSINNEHKLQIKDRSPLFSKIKLMSYTPRSDTTEAKHAIAVPRENQPVSTTLSRAPSSDEMWFLRVSKEYTRPQQEASLPINEPTVNNKCSKHTTSINNENTFQIKDRSPLFSKELIDLIGDKNDERLRVLYENPAQQESQPSIMCLVGSRKKRIKTTPKKMPWR